MWVLTLYQSTSTGLTWEFELRLTNCETALLALLHVGLPCQMNGCPLTCRQQLQVSVQALQPMQAAALVQLIQDSQTCHQNRCRLVLVLQVQGGTNADKHSFLPDLLVGVRYKWMPRKDVEAAEAYRHPMLRIAQRLGGLRPAAAGGTPGTLEGQAGPVRVKYRG